VDRLLSNPGFNVWELFAHWVPYVIAARKEIVVALDWTDFDADGHSTIALYLVTAHGRALPLVWMSVEKAKLKDRRNEYEDTVLLRLHEALPPGVKVTVLADRGFGDQKLYELLTDFGFDFIIRFRGAVVVENGAGERRAASAWVPPNGRIRHLKAARVTADRYPVVLLICAMAMTLLTVLGAAGESLGMDRMLKANTSKKRTHSLFRQGCHYYASIPAMKPEQLEPLVQRFGEYVLREPVYVHAFGLK
jgi:hypothetical protein